MHQSPGIAITAPAAAPSDAGDRIGYLDGWRGLAIFLVLQGHFFAIPGVHSGRMGVDVFFCLSGLLMSRLLFQRRVSLVRFYKRRISRIVPSFLLYVIVVFAVAAALGKMASVGEMVSTVLFLRSYLPADVHIFASPYAIGHLWSLNVEEHSYIFLSLLTLLPFLRGREGWVLIGCGTATVVIHLSYYVFPAIAPAGDFWVRSEVASTNLLLSAGYCLVKDRFAAHVRPWMPLVTFAIASALYVGSVFDWTLTMMVAPYFLAFTVNHLGEAPRWVRSALSYTPLRLLGISSFSIYLWQQPFYQYRRLVLGDGTIAELVAMLASVLVGVAVFYVYENRARLYLNRVW